MKWNSYMNLSVLFIVIVCYICIKIYFFCVELMVWSSFIYLCKREGIGNLFLFNLDVVY